MGKVACTLCGAPILTATAEDTGGLCMPCKTGTRGAIDAAKRARLQERAPDPVRNLWVELCRRVFETSEGFAGLSEAEQQYFAVGVLCGDVYNGGFDAYFLNSSSSYYGHAVRGLESLEASESLALLRRAKHVLFDFDDVPDDISVRRARLNNGHSPSREARLDELDKLFWRDPDSLALRSEAFARAHKLL